MSYLKHEAQHFDDYNRFPHLKQGHQAHLEFRAKLVELIYVESLKGFLKFLSEAENEPEVPIYTLRFVWWKNSRVNWVWTMMSWLQYLIEK